MERMPENIARLYDHLDEEENRQAIIDHFLEIDDSHLWPVSNRFNLTEKALEYLEELENCNGGIYGLELALTIDHQIGLIVNDPDL